MVIAIAFAFKVPIISYIVGGISAFMKHIIDGFSINSNLSPE